MSLRLNIWAVDGRLLGQFKVEFIAFISLYIITTPSFHSSLSHAMGSIEATLLLSHLGIPSSSTADTSSTPGSPAVSRCQSLSLTENPRYRNLGQTDLSALSALGVIPRRN
jgi:hypothetical protein